MNDFMRDLSALISLSNPVDALNFMLNEAKQAGFKTVNLDNLCGYIDYGEGELFGILCHLDVVPPGEGWDSDPFTLTIKDEKAYGRGTSDDKGPALAAFYALKKLALENIKPKMKIRLILGLDEESSGWTCIKRYKLTEEVPLMSVTPDAEYPVINAEKGIANYSFFVSYACDYGVSGGDAANMVPDRAYAPNKVYYGKSAHGSTPELGDNAIIKLAKNEKLSHPLLRFIRSCIDTTGEGLSVKMSDKHSGDLTINAGIIDIDSHRGELIINLRYPVTADECEIFAQVKEVASSFGIETKRLSVSPPLFVPENHPLIKLLLDVYATVTGKIESPKSTGGGTYARAFANSVSFGALFPEDEPLMHQANEYISIDTLEKNIQMYYELMKRL